ncbi:sugar transferase [Verrucomicrobium spinosum]|uniref:sugar transferase n=1 Tax=Verrucomicrobium spinosum TaxID=2736 RepID=UPI00017453C8|nr:sugar transferase [Verrucomicrobium spinosum]
MAHPIHETDRKLVARYLKAGSPCGRAKMRLQLAATRLGWCLFTTASAAIKRMLDVVIAIFALLLLSPLFLLIAVLVKRDGGPVFFKQTRTGLRGKTFGMLKFRSMCVDAEARLKALLAQNEKAGGVTFKMTNDPRVTPVGRWIRRASVDELPQFWNVLKGEMSIVGPRPPLPREVALYTQADRLRLCVKPGITCLWQVGERKGELFEVGDRNAITFDEQVKLDVRYIEHQSTAKDLWLMIKTLPAMLLGK